MWETHLLSLRFQNFGSQNEAFNGKIRSWRECLINMNCIDFFWLVYKQPIKGHFKLQDDKNSSTQRIRVFLLKFKCFTMSHLVCKSFNIALLTLNSTKRICWISCWINLYKLFLCVITNKLPNYNYIIYCVLNTIDNL